MQWDQKLKPQATMSLLSQAKLILSVGFLALTSASQGDCPPWFFPDADNGTECVCSSAYKDMVKCSEHTALLRVDICMTYNSVTENTEVGACPYISQHTNLSSGNFFFQLPKDTSNLSSFMCGSLHRTGLLCGECEDGFGPALYSYTLECSKCWEHSFGWLLYITLIVISTTVLYSVVIVFHVNAPSPPLNAFILFCQITVYTFRLQPALYFFIADETQGKNWLLLL